MNPHESEGRYDAFISYASRRDYSTARRVESFLESFHKTPTPQGIALRRLQMCRDGSDFKLPKGEDQSRLGAEGTVWPIIEAEISKAPRICESR
jgi:hypothetical protein